MNFSGISNQTAVGKLLRFPLRFLPSEMQVPVLQGRLRGMKWIVGSGLHGYWLGSFEWEKRLFFEKTVKEGKVVFDVGAHVGFYTLLASVLVGTHGKVFAFEPLPRNAHYLKEHLRLNHIENVTVIEAAVSDSEGQAAFEEGPANTMGRLSPHGNIQVKAVCLDRLIYKGEVPAPDYIKIDVEGAEELVLLGARSHLLSAHPTIFLSIHGPMARQRCCQFLRSLGYRLQAIGGAGVEVDDEILASK